MVHIDPVPTNRAYPTDSADPSSKILLTAHSHTPGQGGGHFQGHWPYGQLISNEEGFITLYSALGVSVFIRWRVTLPISPEAPIT